MKFNLGNCVGWLATLAVVAVLVAALCVQIGVPKNYSTLACGLIGGFVGWCFNKAFPVLKSED